MASFLAKSVYRSAKLAIKYVVIPVMYTAFLGYLMQEAANAVRPEAEEKHHEDDAAFDPTLRPMP